MTTTTTTRFPKRVGARVQLPRVITVGGKATVLPGNTAVDTGMVETARVLERDRAIEDTIETVAVAVHQVIHEDTDTATALTTNVVDTGTEPSTEDTAIARRDKVDTDNEHITARRDTITARKDIIVDKEKNRVHFIDTTETTTILPHKVVVLRIERATNGGNPPKKLCLQRMRFLRNKTCNFVNEKVWSSLTIPGKMDLGHTTTITRGLDTSGMLKTIPANDTVTEPPASQGTAARCQRKVKTIQKSPRTGARNQNMLVQQDIINVVTQNRRRGGRPERR